jgi:predicted transcriptional regulator
MSNLFFHIGGTGMPDSVMLDYAVEQAEKDPAFEADAHITFTDSDQFFNILTPERIRLLRHVHEHGRVQSVRALAAALNWD